MRTLPPAAEREFAAIERSTGRTIDYPAVGTFIDLVRESHPLMLDLLERETCHAASMTLPRSLERRWYRAEWHIIQAERARRAAGDLPWFMRPTLPGPTIQERCASVHDKWPIHRFIERECGLELRRHRCQCPVHQGDSAISFSIRENRYGHCFKCGWDGDVIALAQEVWRLARPIDAIRRLERL